MKQNCIFNCEKIKSVRGKRAKLTYIITDNGVMTIEEAIEKNATINGTVVSDFIKIENISQLLSHYGYNETF